MRSNLSEKSVDDHSVDGGAFDFRSAIRTIPGGWNKHLPQDAVLSVEEYEV